MRVDPDGDSHPELEKIHDDAQGEAAHPHPHGQVISDEAAAYLTPLFDQLRYSVQVYLFTQKGKNEKFNQAAREILLAFQGLSEKIVYREFSLTDQEARQWKVGRSPTILFHPELYNIRFLGTPAGEEGRTLLEILLLLGMRSSGVSSQSKKILEKIDSPRQLKVFVSLNCPYCPQQAANAVKAAIEKPNLISLEIIEILANPDLAQEYNAMSVPQTYANEVLIVQGAQPEEIFMSSLEKLEQQTYFLPDIDAEQIEADLVIVGGGPAGLTAGIYAARSGLRTVIVEKGTLGGQIATTPIVENYPGFAQVGGKTLVHMMVVQALQYVQIFQDEEALEIQPGSPLVVMTNRRRFLARAVLLATGAAHRHLNVPGEARLAGRGVSYCSTCDGPLFAGKRVAVVGGGNSAATDALYLHNIGVQVTLIHRRKQLRAQEHLMKQILERKIPILWNTEVKEIRGRERVEELLLWNHQSKEKSTMRVNGVFVSIGYDPTVDLAKRVGVEFTPDGYIRHDSHHRTNLAGIYSAGDVEGGFKQIVTAAGQGAEAALSIFEDLVSPYWKAEG